MSRPKQIPLLTKQAEAANLGSLLEKHFKEHPTETQVSIAKKWGISGDGVMLYHHANAKSPISLEAGIAYANGLKVQLSEISPRLASEARKIVNAINGDINSVPTIDLTILEVRLLDLFRSLDEDHKDYLIHSAKMYLDKQKTSRDLLLANTKKAAKKAI